MTEVDKIQSKSDQNY